MICLDKGVLILSGLVSLIAGAAREQEQKRLLKPSLLARGLEGPGKFAITLEVKSQAPQGRVIKKENPELCDVV